MTPDALEMEARDFATFYGRFAPMFLRAETRRQAAKSWELRATMSLCRLWQKQGSRDECRQILSTIYDWFTEGFGTPDLIEAKALLEEL